MPVPGYYEPRGADNYLSAKRNQLRMQPYERLDMRLNKSFVRKLFQANLFAEVINVTNHGNRRFDKSAASTPARERQISDILIPGNYNDPISLP